MKVKEGWIVKSIRASFTVPRLFLRIVPLFGRFEKWKGYILPITSDGFN